MVHPHNRTLVKLMSHLDGVDYEEDATFTQDQLSVLTPQHVMRWLNHKVWGDQFPPDDIENRAMRGDITPLCRNNSVKHWKKALLQLMPNILMQWNKISMEPWKSHKIFQSESIVESSKEKLD